MRHLFAIPVISILILLPGLAEADNTGLAEVTRVTSAIAAIEQQAGPFSATLFDPLMTLARLHIAQGQAEAAENALRRAQNITHRNAGVYSPDQLEAVSLLTELALQGQEFKAANQLQQFAFFVRRHHFESAATLPAYTDLARWYLRTGQPTRAKTLLEEALAAEHGWETLPLALLMTRARRLSGQCCRTDELLAAVQTSTADRDLRATALLTLADSWLLKRQPERAAEYYQKAFATSPVLATSPPLPITIKRQLHQSQAGRMQVYKVRPDPFTGGRLERLSAREQLADQSRTPQWFILDADQTHLSFKAMDSSENFFTQGKQTQQLTGSPFKFSREQLHQILPRRSAGETLRIELTFTVESSGQLKDITVTEGSNAPPALKRLLVNSLRRVYFRPQLDQGRPIDTAGVVLVQTFVPESGELE